VNKSPGGATELSSQANPSITPAGLTARGKMENSYSETPLPPGNTGETLMLTVKTTGGTPVPQFCHGLLTMYGGDENPGLPPWATIRRHLGSD